MMAVIMNNSDKLKDLKVEFAYRYSRTYEAGLSSRLNSQEGVYALNLLNLSGFFTGENGFIRHNLRRVMHIVRFLCIPFIFFDNIIKQYNFLKQNKIDILFLNNGGYPGALSTRTIAIVGRFVGIKKIYMVVNNTAIPYRSIFRRLGYPLDKIVIKCVDTFITGSDNAGKALNEVLGIKKEQRKVIYNCIETKRFNEYIKENREFDPNNEKIIFTNIGLLEKRKGQIVLLNAIQHLLTLRPELRNKLHINIEG
jgi:glycosyltransferase involved in cell wall biosynthesis